MMNQQRPGSLKGPFPKMLMGGKYLRRVDTPYGDSPFQANMDAGQRPGAAPRMVTQPPFRFDGNQFQFDFRNGLLR